MYTIFLACVFHVETKWAFGHLKRKINIYGLILKFHDTTNISIVCIQKSITNTGALAPPSIILHTQQNSCFLHCSFGHIIRPSQCTFLQYISIYQLYLFLLRFLPMFLVSRQYFFCHSFQHSMGSFFNWIASRSFRLVCNSRRNWIVEKLPIVDDSELYV